jgi:hypothetical protein
VRAVCTCACFWTNVHAFYKRVTKGAKRRRGATLNRRPTARRHYLSNSRTDSFEPFIHHSSHPWPILSPCWYMLVHAIVALSRLHSLSFTRASFPRLSLVHASTYTNIGSVLYGLLPVQGTYRSINHEYIWASTGMYGDSPHTRLSLALHSTRFARALRLLYV